MAAFKFTAPMLLMVTWVVLATFNYGFGISELNPLQASLTCPARSSSAADAKARLALPHCFDLTSALFGLLTSLFTLGGLISSLLLPLISARRARPISRRQALLASAGFSALGTGLQAASTGFNTMAAGRFLMGAGAGLGIVTVPAYLSDISPPALRGSIGVLNQLSIVLGILIAQALGVSPLGAPAPPPVAGKPQPTFPAWRWVPVFALAVAALQLVGFSFAMDSPSEVREKRRATRIRRRLWGSEAVAGEIGSAAGDGAGEEEQDALLGGEALGRSDGHERPGSSDASETFSLSSLVGLVVSSSSSSLSHLSPPRRHALRRGLLLIVMTQLAQQLSGVNAVLSFSTGIMSDALGVGKDGGEEGRHTAKLIGLGITVVNALMTFPPIYLIQERPPFPGRRGLLLISGGSMSASMLLLSVGILFDVPLLSAACLVSAIAAFSMGLGPVPFLILPELVEEKAIPTASSLGLALNWSANFLVSTFFLPLRDGLAERDGGSGGSVFLVFAALNAVACGGIARFYRYEARE